MNSILSPFIVGLCVLGTLESRAQFLVDNNHRPLTEKRYVDVSGTPYFNELFFKGTVRLVDNKEYNDELLQYDQVKEQLLFKSNKDDEFPSEFNVPVAEFKLVLPDGKVVIFENITPTGNSKSGLYQVIYKGKVSLFKRTKKNIVQNASYSTANTEKRVTSSTAYLIKTADFKYLIVKTDKEALLNVLSDKVKELDMFISRVKIDVKLDQDLEKLLTFYNSLF
jgi:hypothetical protein